MVQYYSEYTLKLIKTNWLPLQIIIHIFLIKLKQKIFSFLIKNVSWFINVLKSIVAEL